MLTELHIQNFAIIDKLDLKLGPGLIILTGETGAGKSIILDAVEMVVGGRADATVVRTDAAAAVVEATFKLIGPEKDAVNAALQREELLDDPNYVTLAREVRREGRNIARVNGRAVPVALLKEIGASLVDIHGQSEHLSLLDPHAHLGLLDRFADVGKPLADYRRVYEHLAGVRAELKDLRLAQADAERRIEMLTFQAEEIEDARLNAGEDADLRKERDRLANAEALAEFAQQALQVLDEGSQESAAASDLVGQAARALAGLAKIDTGRADLADQAAMLEDTLSELVRSLRDYLEEIEYNPRRLDEIEERLNLIHNLTRKYGGDIPAVIKFGQDARLQLETISGATERIAALEAEEAQLLQALSGHAQTLSDRRRQAAEKLGQGIEAELDDLKMASARFGVDFQTRPDPNGLPLPDGSRLAFDQTGFDRVEFLVAPNPGEGLKPLAKIASGGETSRLMLALKDISSRGPDPLPHF